RPGARAHGPGGAHRARHHPCEPRRRLCARRGHGVRPGLTRGRRGERMSLEDRIAEIIVEQLGVSREEISPDASFIEDLGADSLDIVELVMAMEEEVGVEVPDEDAEKLQTVGDVIKYIEEKASKQQ